MQFLSEIETFTWSYMYIFYFRDDLNKLHWYNYIDMHLLNVRALIIFTKQNSVNQ